MIYASPGHEYGVFHHSSFLAGEPVAGAGIGEGVNVAVFEYLDDAGNLQTIVRGSVRGVGHSEALIARELAARGVSNDRGLRIYSDLEPCNAPGGYCARMISEGSRS